MHFEKHKKKETAAIDWLTMADLIIKTKWKKKIKSGSNMVFFTETTTTIIKYLNLHMHTG